MGGVWEWLGGPKAPPLPPQRGSVSYFRGLGAGGTKDRSETKVEQALQTCILETKIPGEEQRIDQRLNW